MSTAEIIYKNTGEVEDILSWITFVTLHLENPEKTNFHPWKFFKNVWHSLEIPRSKTKDYCRNFTWVFGEQPWKLIPGIYSCSFFITPGNSMSSSALFGFFLEQPNIFNIKIIDCTWSWQKNGHCILYSSNVFYCPLSRLIAATDFFLSSGLLSADPINLQFEQPTAQHKSVILENWWITLNFRFLSVYGFVYHLQFLLAFGF